MDHCRIPSQKNLKKNIISILATMSLFFYLSISPARALTIRALDNTPLPTDNSIPITNPTPRVNLPGLNFTPGQAIEGQLNEAGQIVIGIPYLAEYISAAYRYAVAIAAILAIIMIIVAGFQWTLSGGNTDTISKAQHRITGAVTGLIIALGSYTLLYTINPELVQFRSLKITYIEPKSFAYQDGGDPAAGADLDITKIKQNNPSIFCPASKPANPSLIPQIVNSMKFKMAYRFGGKGQMPPPPYPESSPYDSYKNSCPGGNLCFDCSGFINLVYTCAGLDSPGNSTVTILTPGDKVKVSELKDCTLKTTNSDSSGKETTNEQKFAGGIDFDNWKFAKAKDNGECDTPVDLKPGDILGWRPNEGGKQYGHVVLYVGNGETVEMSGGYAGRQIGSNPTFKNLSDFKDADGYKFTYIRHP